MPVRTPIPHVHRKAAGGRTRKPARRNVHRSSGRAKCALRHRPRQRRRLERQQDPIEVLPNKDELPAYIGANKRNTVGVSFRKNDSRALRFRGENQKVALADQLLQSLDPLRCEFRDFAEE